MVKTNGAAGRDRLKILVIEDDAVVRDVLCDILSSMGHEVQNAPDGMRGIARLESEHGAVDVVLTDLQMPGMTGWDVAHAVKSGWPQVKVALLTADPEAPARASEHPVDVVLSKPLALMELSTALTNVVGSR
jgi:CheY-like chemotaxis protein